MAIGMDSISFEATIDRASFAADAMRTSCFGREATDSRRREIEF
ncbi:MAG: hypothetical protein WKG00_08525 [Polyangiaceae bacterium]